MLPLLLYLWRVLPLPKGLRWFLMWHGNTRFVVGVSALIVNEQGHVLLFKHTYRRRFPWGLPGGWLGGGERPEDALRRELREEGGLTVAVDGIALVDMNVRRRHLDLMYRCRYVGGAFRPSAEVSACAYFALDTLPDIMPAQRRQLVRVLQS